MPTKAEEAETRFATDVRFEVTESKTRGAREAARLALEAGFLKGVSTGTAIAYAQAVETEGERLVDALIPRFELAFGTGNAKVLEAAFVAGLDEYLQTARGWFKATVGSGQQVYGHALESVRVRLGERVAHGIRGIASKPRPKWHERHPLAFALGLALIAALLPFVFDLAKDLLTDSTKSESTQVAAPTSSKADVVKSKP